MYRLLLVLRPVLMLATFAVAVDTGSMARVADWALGEAQWQQPACCAAVPSTGPGVDGLVQHVQQLNAVVRWASSWGGVDLPS